MLVNRILGAKKGARVLTVEPAARVRDAVAMLSQGRIGALVVSVDGKRVDGMISERDIVRELGKQGEQCLSREVSEIMSKSVVTCSEDETADQVLTKMSTGRFRHLPVVEGGIMIGLISIGDVVQARLSELNMEKEALESMIMGH